MPWPTSAWVAGDRVMVLCDTRPEWHMIDLAVLDLGAVNVPIYGTLTPEQVAYQVQDSGARVAVAEDAEQMAKFLEVRDRCPDLAHLLQLEGERAAGVLALEELMSAAKDGAGERFWERAARIDEDDLATIVYTSGTTGEPKGVMLTHRNIVDERRRGPRAGGPLDRRARSRVPAPVPHDRAGRGLHVHEPRRVTGLLLGVSRRRV